MRIAARLANRSRPRRLAAHVRRNARWYRIEFDGEWAVWTTARQAEAKIRRSLEWQEECGRMLADWRARS